MVAPPLRRSGHDSRDAAGILAPEIAVDRDDVPWRPSSRTWLRRLTLARFVLLVPLAAGLIYALVRGFVGDASRVFFAILVATSAQTLLFRFGARDGAKQSVATPCLFVSLVVDCVMLAIVASATSGLTSPMAFALVLPVAIAGLTLSRAPALVVFGATLGSVLLLAAEDASSSAGLPVYARAGGVAAVLLATFIGALWFRARLAYLESRLLEREAALEAQNEIIAIDFEELPALPRSPPLVLTAREPTAKPSPPEEFGEHGLAAIAEQLGSELRDPAGVIRARAESLRYELKDRERRDNLLAEFARLLRAADRLDDVRLTLATLAGTAASGPAECDARALVLELRTAFVDDFERDGVKLRLEAPRGISPVALSHNELRLVVVRLIDASRRAALAAGRNARVTARVSGMGAGVCLEVEDNLPIAGMPPLDAAATFDVEKRPGLGLALAVARHILAVRGGELEIVPRRIGGLLVRARLPVAGAEGGNPANRVNSGAAL